MRLREHPQKSRKKSAAPKFLGARGLTVLTLLFGSLAQTTCSPGEDPEHQSFAAMAAGTTPADKTPRGDAVPVGEDTPGGANDDLEDERKKGRALAVPIACVVPARCNEKASPSALLLPRLAALRGIEKPPRA